jgi:thiol-disulfide isomerase/thioredoxin
MMPSKQARTVTVLAIMLILSGCALQRDIAFARPNAAVGMKAASLSGSTVDGKPLTIRFTGQRTVLVFWASWCGPCRHEQPGLNRLAAEFAGRVSFYGVDFLDHDRSQARAFAQEFHVPYPSIYDDPGKLAADFGVDAPPAQILVDGRGVIVGRVPGEVSEAQLRTMISQKLRP